MPAALLKCQSRKRTRLPCLPPARLTLVQAEAELSVCPLPMARMSTGLGKRLEGSQPPTMCSSCLVTSSPAPVHQYVQASSYCGSKLKVCTGDTGQDLPAGDTQVLMRPQKGGSVISDHGPQCLQHLMPAELILTKEEGAT